MAMPCIVCKQDIKVSWNQGVFTGDETTSIMFAGDATYERGRYNIHERCMRPEFAKQLLTMAMLEGREPIPSLVER